MPEGLDIFKVNSRCKSRAYAERKNTPWINTICDWNGTVQTRLKLIIWCSLIRTLSVYDATLTVYNHNHLLTQFVQIAKDYWEEPNFVSTFSKSYKTRGSRYPGSLTWTFQALKAVLYVRTGYQVRSVAVRMNPLQTLLIRTNPYLHRSKPFFILSAHALTRVVPYLTVSFSY